MRTRSSGRFRKNSLAAAAATTAMGAASASAAIIHVDPVDITLGPTFGSHTIDFTGTVPLSQTLNIFGGISKGTQSFFNSGGGGAAGGTAEYLQFGDTFNSSDLAVNGGFVPHMDIGANIYLALGFTADGSSFVPGSTGNHLGWVRLTQTAPDTVVIHEWAFQDQVDVAIAAGEGGAFTPPVVAEPGTLLLFAAGTAIAMRMYAKRKHQ